MKRFFHDMGSKVSHWIVTAIEILYSPPNLQFISEKIALIVLRFGVRFSSGIHIPTYICYTVGKVLI